jgi:hypothetical protein
MNEQQIPEILKEWREKNKHLMEKEEIKNTRPSQEIMAELMQLCDDIINER